jgi:pimeloyl-ACP methyl ester carboxylesterase
VDEGSDCGPECLSAHYRSNSALRSTAIATTTALIQDPPVEACLAQLLDHLGIAGAHFAGRSLADVQGFIAKHSERIASLTLVCPTVLNPRSLAPLGARQLVVIGDHGLGARRVQAVLPALPEATAVVLEDYAGLTWADLAADRGERIDTAMREFLQHRDPRCRRPACPSSKARPPASRFACAAPDHRWCCCLSTSRRANGNR